VLNNCDESFSKTVWENAGWAQAELQREELYDLILDPLERVNRSKASAYADAADDMRARLNKFMRETDDPLLSGSVAPPDGAVVAPCV